MGPCQDRDDDGRVDDGGVNEPHFMLNARQNREGGGKTQIAVKRGGKSHQLLDNFQEHLLSHIYATSPLFSP